MYSLSFKCASMIVELNALREHLFSSSAYSKLGVDKETFEVKLNNLIKIYSFYPVVPFPFVFSRQHFRKIFIAFL